MTSISSFSSDNCSNKLIENIEQISDTSKTKSQNEFHNAKIQQVKIQQTLVVGDFVDLIVTDTCEDEEKHKPRRRSWDRSRGKDKRNSRDRMKEQVQIRVNHRIKRKSGSLEGKKELFRRDPNKSNKDIEQDKLRTKKNNDNKILAEKEKAIKTLLDSDNVVPPGTEGEAIQNIVNRNQQQIEEEISRKNKRISRDNQRRSLIHNRLGYKRFSPRRSPIIFSPDHKRRRSSHQLSPDERRRREDSFERENSIERREVSRRRLREREAKFVRRSRSRDRRSVDRHRSRSLDRQRRSPIDRHSPRRLYNSRRRSLSRSPIRSPSRCRRRSPFINELARQFQTESIRVENRTSPVQQSLGALQMGSSGPPFMTGRGGPPSIHSGGLQTMDPRMMSGFLSTQRLIPGTSTMTPTPSLISSCSMDIHPTSVLHSRPQGVLEPSSAGLSFINYDRCQPGPPGINFDPISQISQSSVSSDHSASFMYNQGNSMSLMNSTSHIVQPSSPKPVPAPGQGFPGSVVYKIAMGPSIQYQSSNIYGLEFSSSPCLNQNSVSPHEVAFRKCNKREDRMKTPEPPIISNFKQNEKTSLSSLLEASVSTKGLSSLTPSFRGFRPEIIRHCERALRSLPIEDPRLKMKGRFFFDPTKKDKTDTTSNSILLRKSRTEIHWNEEENQIISAQQHHLIERKRLITHQKICQTDELTKESVSTQTEPIMIDFAMQVCLQDFNYNTKDEWMTLNNRLDWSMRETYDHKSKLRDNDDLRWSLTNNSARERQMSPWLSSFSSNCQPAISSSEVPTTDTRCNIELLRERSCIDQPIDIRDRSINLRTKCMDFRDKDTNLRNIRSMDIIKEREWDHERELERERILDGIDSRGNVSDGGRGLKEYRGHKESFEEYEICKNVRSSYVRSMETTERHRKEMQTLGLSPVVLDDDSEELEIIEERLLEREQSWKSRINKNSLIQFSNNARGSAIPGLNRNNLPVNRPFRGRITSYRMNF